MEKLFLRIHILPIRSDIVNARPKGENKHQDGKNERCRQIGCECRGICKSGINGALEDANDYARNLHAGLDFAKHIGGNYNARRARNHQTNRGYCKLTEDNDHHRPKENSGENAVDRAITHHLVKDNKERANDHKLIGKGVKKLAKIGNKVVFTRNFAVKHIGESRRAKERTAHKVCSDSK